MNSKRKKYHLLYLPAGKLIEVLGPAHPTPKTAQNVPFTWHVLAKNRSDLKVILSRIIAGQFPVEFFKRNEITPYTAKPCHFVFQRIHPPLKENKNDETNEAISVQEECVHPE